MLRPSIAAGVVALCLATASQGQARPPLAPEAIRVAVIGELLEARAFWMAPTDRRQGVPPSTGLLSRADLNGDGVDDWVADYAQAEQSQLWCGTGGCRLQIWMGQADGDHRLALDDQVFSMTRGVVDGERRLEFAVHGSECGGAGPDPCAYAFSWEPTVGRLVERPTAEGRTRLDLGGFDPLPEQWPPPEVMQALAVLGETCIAALPPELIPAADVPDLNGDGLRDWVLYSFHVCPEAPGRVIVLTGGGWRQAYQGPARGFAVELGGPATLLLDPVVCPTDERPCPETRLVWDAGSRRLREDD